jgi:TRAP-type C4-dicarboxylate transport system permease small subunit
MPRLLDGCERIMTLVAVVAAFAMMLLTTADAGGRYLFNRPILVALEVTTNYLMIAAVFLAMPYAYRTGSNIRVTFLVDRLRGTPRLVVDHLVQIVSILYCVLLVVATFQQVRNMFSTGTLFITVELPIWPGHALVCLGLLLSTVMMLLDLREVRRGRSSLFKDSGQSL